MHVCINLFGLHYCVVCCEVEKKFTVTRKMLTAVARDRRWPDVVVGISARFLKKLLFYSLLYNESLNEWSFGEQ